MINKVLILLDGTVFAETALNYAMQFSSKLGAELVVACITESGCDANTTFTVPRIGKKVEVSRITIDGDPFKGSIACIKEKNVDLIIMITRSMSEINEKAIADIGMKILRRTKRPVIFIRSDEQYGQFDDLIKNILVPLDGSEEAESVVKYVGGIASAFRAEVILLEVISLETQAVVGLLAYDSYEQKRLETERVLALDYLGKIATQLKEQYRNIKVLCKTKAGLAAAEIIGYASEIKADMVAMSTRGHTGLRRLVFGSTATEVIRYCNKNLLLLKQ